MYEISNLVSMSIIIIIIIIIIIDIFTNSRLNLNNLLP
jgi:hypothetical protein